MSSKRPVNADDQNRFAPTPRRYFITGYIRRYSNCDSSSTFLNNVKIFFESKFDELKVYCKDVEIIRK